MTAAAANARPLPAAGISLRYARLARAVLCFCRIGEPTPPCHFGIELLHLLVDRGLRAAPVIDLGGER
ncbi:MAG TPA: hypothetical protein VE865_15390, partial [Bradyrhizobium sp.]|nr:hypothetical protein [Bradyrhizobium sp.]